MKSSILILAFCLSVGCKAAPKETSAASPALTQADLEELLGIHIDTIKQTLGSAGYADITVAESNGGNDAYFEDLTSSIVVKPKEPQSITSKITAVKTRHQGPLVYSRSVIVLYFGKDKTLIGAQQRSGTYGP